MLSKGSVRCYCLAVQTRGFPVNLTRLPLSGFSFIFILSRSPSRCPLMAPGSPASLYNSFLFCVLKLFTYQETVLACSALFPLSQDIHCVFNSTGSINKFPVYFNIAPFLLGDGGTSKCSRVPCPAPVPWGFHHVGNTEGCSALLAWGSPFGHGHSSTAPIHLSSYFIQTVIPAFGSACSFLLGKKPTGAPGTK